MSKFVAALVLATLLVGVNSSTVKCTNRIKKFETIDTSVKPPIIKDITPVVDLLDFPTCKLNVQAVVETTPSNCNQKPVQCVKFFLNGTLVQTERVAPYTLFGDIPGKSTKSKKPPIGPITLKACMYTNSDCETGRAGCKTVKVNFKDCKGPPPPPPCKSVNEIVSFALVDAENPKKPVVTPFTPPVIDLLDFPTCELNIFAVGKNNTCGLPPIGCVQLSMGSAIRRERVVPYSLFGDRTGRVVYDRKPELGPNKLQACTYTDTDCKVGQQGCLTVEVLVKDCIPMSMPF
jgi:hypothetical protein